MVGARYSPASRTLMTTLTDTLIRSAPFRRALSTPSPDRRTVPPGFADPRYRFERSRARRRPAWVSAPLRERPDTERETGPSRPSRLPESRRYASTERGDPNALLP